MYVDADVVGVAHPGAGAQPVHTFVDAFAVHTTPTFEAVKGAATDGRFDTATLDAVLGARAIREVEARVVADLAFADAALETGRIVQAGGSLGAAARLPFAQEKSRTAQVFAMILTDALIAHATA